MLFFRIINTIILAIDLEVVLGQSLNGGKGSSSFKVCEEACPPGSFYLVNFRWTNYIILWQPSLSNSNKIWVNGNIAPVVTMHHNKGLLKFQPA